MIIKNETRRIGFQITGTSPFSLDPSSVAMSTMAPDGTVRDYAGGGLPGQVNVTPGNTDSLNQILSTDVSFNQSGVWRVEWAAAIADENKLFEELYFVSFSDIWTGTRSKVLGLNANRIPDNQLDPMFSAVSLALISEFPCIGSYDSLTWPDTFHFDRALEYLSGLAIQRANPTNYPGGHLNQITQGPITYKYGTDRIPLGVDVYNDAWTEINQISCVKAAFQTFMQNNGLYALAGKDRAVKAVYNITKDSNILLQLTAPGYLFPLIPYFGWGPLLV